MNKLHPCIIITFILIMFILFHNSLVIALANINSIFRENNEIELLKKSYESKVENLEKNIAEYELSMKNLKIYESENFVLSKIALRDVYDFYNFLVISTDTLVEKDDAVINENGLVGIVDSSNKKTATVSLLTGDISLSVKVGSSYGILDEYNKEDNLFIVHNINNYKEINVGDEVVTSGLTNIKDNLYIGKVQKTEKKGIEQIVYVKSNVNFDELNYLYVVS